MLISHIMQFIRHVIFKQLPALLEVNLFPQFSMFHVEGLKYPAKSAEVYCFLLSLVDCHKELSLPLAQMNKTYISFLHSTRHR